MLIDLALDLLTPPLATLTLAVILGGALGAASVFALGRPGLVLVPWLCAAAMLIVYVLRGVALSGLGARGVLVLFWAPAYIAWKVALRLRRSGARRGEWVRTARDGQGA